MINGILVIDKDKEMTSADVVYQLRKALHIKKIGHAGTLDPDVTGVLPIALGQATKLIELMHTKNKKYFGTGILGFSTDSYDLSGKVLQAHNLIEQVPAEDINTAMQQFIGEIEQVPPIYSAVRVNGRHLYEYARENITVKRPKRRVKVFSYDLVGTPIFNKEKGQEEFNFEVECSKGTYVRSLVNDLSDILNIPATMKSLRRTASSGFDISQAVKLADIISDPTHVAQYVQPIEIFFKDYQQIDLTQEQWKKVQNGAAISLQTNEKQVALRYNKRVKAIYQIKGHLYCPKLMLLQNK